jgi:hypothetical protein
MSLIDMIKHDYKCFEYFKHDYNRCRFITILYIKKIIRMHLYKEY